MADNNNTNTLTEQKPFYEREMSSQSGILGWRNWGNTPQPKPDTLTLEYPALASQINSALAQGVDRNKLRNYLAERENIALMQYPMSQVNQFLGRDEKSVTKFLEEMKGQKDNAYVQIMKYDMSEAKVRDILKTAQLSGITPGVLFKNPELLAKAEELAGRREGFFGQAIAAVWNMFANYNQSSVGDELTNAQTYREAVKDDSVMREEGLRIWNAGLKTTLLPPPDEKLIAMGRDSYEKRAKELEEAAKIDAHDVERWAEHVRPPDSWLGNILVNAIQNFGFTGWAMIRSGAGWYLGGPAGLALMSAYNTIDESEREAGEAFMEAEKRGKSPEEALQIAKEVRAKNMLYLPASNYGADYIFYKGAELIGKYTDPYIPGTGALAKLARMGIRNVLPFFLDAQTEGWEEYFQEMFKMQALDDEIDQSTLWDAFKLGFADTIIYSLAGSLINKGLRAGGAKVYSMTSYGKTQQHIQQQLDTLVGNIQEVQQLAEQIKQGNLNPDDIVGENPIVFIPSSKLNDGMAQALGIHQELIETESGEFVAEDNSNAQAIDNAQTDTLQNLEGITGLDDLEGQQEAQQEENVDDEVAVRKADWDKFVAENPQEAQELLPFVREGTEGITANEQLQEKLEPIIRAANDNAEVREAIPKLTQALVDAGRSEAEAQTLATVAGAIANSMSQRYSNIDAAQVMNVTVAEAISNSQGSTAEGTPITPSNTARIRTMKGTEVDVQYRIVDADSLIVSTLENGSPNPAYPQELQPRQRDREASRNQIRRIGARLDPELLGANRMASDGAPVIGPDMVVESGNGRVLGIREAYKRLDRAENYRAWLRDNASAFGLNADDVNSVKKPVLVRERISDVDRTLFTREANETSVSAMSSTENAMNDARKITPSLLRIYDVNLPLQANRDFIASLSYIFPESERNSLMQSNGRISQAGLNRVRNALAAKAYNDTSILNRLGELYDDEIKNVSNALIQAASNMAIFETSDRREDISLQNDIVRAVNLLSGIKERGQKVSEYVAQPSLFREDDLSEAGTKLLEFFDRNKRSAKKIAGMLIRYAELAMNEAGVNQGVLFEDTVRSKESILDEAINYAENQDNQRLGLNFESYNQPAQLSNQNSVSALDMKSVYDELHKFREFPRIPDLRRALNWPRQVFDEMIRTLRDSRTIRIMRADYSILTQDEIQDCFVDENNFVMGTMLWNDRATSDLQNISIPMPQEQVRNNIDGNDASEAENIAVEHEQETPQLEQAKEQEQISDEAINARSSWPEGASSVDTATFIEFFSSANASSGFHELGHHIFRVLTDAAKLNSASEDLLHDVNTIFKNAGVKPQDFYNNTGEARSKAHEYFSTAFETYLAEGKAPVKELQSTFDRIKAWLVDVYHNITQALGLQLNDEMREIFDRLLASPEQFAEEKSLQDVTAMYKAGEAEIEKLQQEISQLEQEARDSSQQWEDTAERAYIKGKNRGEDYGIKEGREYQRKIDKAKLEQRIAKLKERFDDLKARQKERRIIREKSRKLINRIKRMAKTEAIIWNRQQQIKNLLDTYDVDKLGRLSLQDIQYLYDQVKKIYDAGVREMKAKQLAEYERIEGLRQKLRETLEGLIPDEKGAIRDREDLRRQYEGARGVAQKAIDWTMAKTMGAQRFFDYLDGGHAHYNGVWVKTFVDEANRAYDAELRFKFARLAALEKTMQELGITAKMLSQTRDVDVPHVGNRAWTVDMLMSIYAGMKNPRSRDAILYGNFKEAGEQAEAWAAKCIEALTDNERALADAVIREYEENRERINQALIDIYNKGMAFEKNYTPMRRLEFTARNGSWLNPDAGEDVLAGQQGSGMDSVQRGFAEKRVNFNPINQNPIQLGLVNIWHSQVETQEHVAAFGQLVRDLRRVLLGKGEGESRTIRQMIKQAYGNDAWEMVRRYFNILSNNDTQNAYDTLEGLSRIMAKNMSIAYLCGNLGTMLKQLNSFTRVLPYAGPVNMINAIGQFLQNPTAFLEQCYELDPQLRNRKGDPFIRELQGNSNGVYKTLLQWGSAPIGWTDRAASAVAFKAVYDANIKHGLSQEQAVREAQRAVLLTQPATNIKDKPLVWQQHGYAKLAMMFTNDMAQTFGLTLYDLTQQIRNGEISKTFSSVVGLTLAATLIRFLTSGAPDEPDDPEEFAKWIAGAFAEQEINSIPIIGKEAVTLWDARNGYFNGHSAFIAPFAKLAAGAKGLWDDKNDNDERAIFNLLEGGSLLAPFPATALKRLWGTLKEAGKGEVLRALKNLVGMRLQDKKFIHGAYAR